MQNLLAIMAVVVVLVVVGVGYFSTTGNVVLKDGGRPEISTSPGATQDLVLKETDEPAEVDECKNIVCDKSSLVCTDGVKVFCSNSCKDGVCGSCKPDCKGHEKVVEIKKTQENQATTQSPKPTATSVPSSTVSQTPISTPPEETPLPSPTASQSQETQLSVSLSLNSQTIQRGSDVVITAKVTDNQSPVEAASVDMTLTYASGTQASNSSLTDSNGEFIWTKRIGGNSKTGTFTVDAKATKSGYLDGTASTTFEVVNATG